MRILYQEIKGVFVVFLLQDLSVEPSIGNIASITLPKIVPPGTYLAPLFLSKQMTSMTFLNSSFKSHKVLSLSSILLNVSTFDVFATYKKQSIVEFCG